MPVSQRFMPFLKSFIFVFLTNFVFTIGGFSQNTSTVPSFPCDEYALHGTPCVTAHSTTRLLANYKGPLYQVKRLSDGKTLDIGTLPHQKGEAVIVANAAAQDAFCDQDVCFISIIYDQSGNKNHLLQAPPGTFVGPAPGGFNTLPIADMAPVTLAGHKVYGSYVMPGMGLRNNNAVGLAINDEPQGIYMVFDGGHFDSGCCFNYGNTSTNSQAVGTGTMATVYFGTSTAWGKGAGKGPWIMSDMEAGLFSGYDAKENIADPTIDGWRFVTGMVNGGGGNKWEIRGGNAQDGKLATFYQGERPGSRENNTYFPMHRKGAVQMGNGGDNGNGSAGTFYEGIMVIGYPKDEAIHGVQQNIVASKYDLPYVQLSRMTSFGPTSTQEVTLTYHNSSGKDINNLKLSLKLPVGWKTKIAGESTPFKMFSEKIKAGETIKVNFMVTSPTNAIAGYLKGSAEWESAEGKQTSFASQRIRTSPAVKINEVRFKNSLNVTDQFIELYNGSDKEVDLSGWSLINTKSEWAPVELANIPKGKKLKPKAFYLLGLSAAGLVAPALKGDKNIYLSAVEGLKAGDQIDVAGEKVTIAKVGTAASPMTTIFVPVSTGPWLTFPVGTTKLPVTNATGFIVGDKIGIDAGGKFELATVTSVGKASTQTNLVGGAKKGDTFIKVIENANMSVGDVLTINTGARRELVEVKRIIKVVAASVRGRQSEGPGEVELTKPLMSDHMDAVDASDPGTGIEFSPATKFVHVSGQAVQALGSGITLSSALKNAYKFGTPINGLGFKNGGYQGKITPNQWYGGSLSGSAGSIALMDASGKVLVDGLVYGSQQSNSSANGTIPSPEIATLEGVQSQGGCIAVVPTLPRRFIPVAGAPDEVNVSLGLFPDGNDNDSNCNDFRIQKKVNLATGVEAGAKNIKILEKGGLEVGQTVFIGSELAVVKEIGGLGATISTSESQSGSNKIFVESVFGFIVGQEILVGKGSQMEKVIVSEVTPVRRRFGAPPSDVTDSITLSTPLKNNHSKGVSVAGSGITLNAALKSAHEKGEQVGQYLPTPGERNRY
ncbi:MAG: arabinofuranosidase catalytic domain-containing protein [Saprospiraceae bacterium]